MNPLLKKWTRLFFLMACITNYAIAFMVPFIVTEQWQISLVICIFAGTIGNALIIGWFWKGLHDV